MRDPVRIEVEKMVQEEVNSQGQILGGKTKRVYAFKCGLANMKMCGKF